jgi:hypothetical protein
MVGYLDIYSGYGRLSGYLQRIWSVIRIKLYSGYGRLSGIRLYSGYGRLSGIRLYSGYGRLSRYLQRIW